MLAHALLNELFSVFPISFMLKCFRGYVDLPKTLRKDYTGLRPIYVIFFEVLPISFQMKNNGDMVL